MTYPENVDLEAEKAARIYIHNECVMISGIIDRMFLVDDLMSLNKAYASVTKRIDKVYDYHFDRIQELKKLNVKAAE